MTLEQLRALVMVHAAGSLAAAARQSRVPRTTLKRRIAELEAHLQVPLLHPSHDGAALTVAGLELVRKGRPVLDQVETLSKTLRGARTSGRLRIAYPVGIHPSVVIAGTRLLLDALPNVQFQALLGTVGDDPTRFDIAIHLGDTPTSGPFVARVMAHLPMRLMAGAAYPRPLPEHPDELEDHPLLCWSDRENLVALPLVNGGSVRVSPRIVTSDLHFLHWAGRHGLGLVWVVDGGVEEAPDVAPLHPVLEGQVGAMVPMWIVVPRANRDVPWIREAIDRLLVLAGAPDLW